MSIDDHLKRFESTFGAAPAADRNPAQADRPPNNGLRGPDVQHYTPPGGQTFQTPSPPLPTTTVAQTPPKPRHQAVVGETLDHILHIAACISAEVDRFNAGLNRIDGGELDASHASKPSGGSGVEPRAHLLNTLGRLREFMEAMRADAAASADRLDKLV